MPIISRDKPRDFVPAPEGSHTAVCVDVVDLGLVDGAFGPKMKIRLVWQLEERRPDGKPWLVSGWYTNSLNEKSRLRPLLEAWRGRAFTPEELGGFDLEDLVGSGCLLQVIHNPTPKGIFANVASIMKLPKGMEAPRVADYTRVSKREGYRAPELPTDPADDWTPGADEPSDEVPF
jgi:hypothetical protein